MSTGGNRLQVFGGDNDHENATPSPEFRRRLVEKRASSDSESESESEESESDVSTAPSASPQLRKPGSGRSSQLSSKFPSSREMNANKKLFGKDLREYENMDMDDLLDQLTPEEIDILTREVDPDDSLMPPDQRTAYRCEKKATGPLDRKQLIDYIHEQALNDPDRPEMVPFQAGTVRGKKWVAPTSEKSGHRTDEEIALDLDDEYESALGDATENELVDLAAILGFHSMMNQDQYHASLLGKKMEGEVGWGGITRASRPKPLAPEPPNLTDPEQSIDRLKRDDPQLKQLNFNNIKNMSDEQLTRLFEAAAGNAHMESLLMANTGLCDRHADKLADLLEANSTITEISLESNFISPTMMSRLVKALLKNKSVETFRAANQRSQVLGNKIEMEITKYVEQNTNLLQLGLHFDFNDSRARISAQLQKNRDRFREQRVGVKSTARGSLSLQLPASGAAGERAESPEPAQLPRGTKSSNFVTPIGRVASPLPPPSPTPSPFAQQ